MVKLFRWLLVVLMGLPLTLTPLRMDPPLYAPAGLAFAVGGLVAGALQRVRGRRVCSELFHRFWIRFLLVLAGLYTLYWLIWSNTFTSSPARDSAMFVLVVAIAAMLGFLAFFGEGPPRKSGKP